MESKEALAQSRPSVQASSRQVYPEPEADASVPKSHQFRALSKKAVSFQKRQMFTNVCCICLCPLMMVAISAFLGTLINTLIAKSSTAEDILYCGNNASLNDAGFPIFNTSDPRVYGFKTTNGKSVNFYFYTGNILTFGGGQTSHACVHWFGENYPQNSAIYERNAGLSGISKLDSTYMVPPDNGWVTALTNLAAASSSDYLSMVSTLSTNQVNQWFLASSASGLSDILGARPQKTALSVAGAVAAGIAAISTPFTSYSTAPDSSGNKGMLGSIEGRLYINVSSPTTFNSVPFAEIKSTTSDDDLDDLLSVLINQVITGLAGLDKSVLLSSDSSTKDLINFYKSAQQVTQVMPHGALYLNSFSSSSLSLQMTLHFGKDSRIATSGNFPSQGFRQLNVVTQLGQVALRSLLGSSGHSGSTITQGIRIFPQSFSTAVDFPFGGLIGRVLYPFGVSFLLPIFTIMLVKEKEERIFIMMKLNGLKTWTYYLSHYITFYILYTFSAAIFLIAGIQSKLTFFTQTQIGVLILLFFIWGHVQIVLAFLFSTLFSKSRIALVLVFLVVLVGVIISLVSERLYSKTTAPMAYLLWPPFAFYRSLSIINTASYTTTLQPYKTSMLVAGNEVYTCISFLIGEVFVYGVVALYLSFIVPSEFGKALPWHFPITMPIAKFQKQQRRKLNNGIDPLSETQLAQTVVIDTTETQFEDADVKEEKNRVEQGEYPRDSPLVISHMRKVYPSRGGLGPKFAVKDISFAADMGTVFGLLGPNGAGKTTLISILTGLYPASFGNAILAGFDIKSDASDICKVMGICPQFDILWEELTVEEHLYFYARMKGAEPSTEKQYVQRALQNVSLTSLADRQTKRLSGGEKRRLSIAIALIGNPKIVFLDEPTTGLDPEVRRLIWNIIQHAKENKTVVLTTHSMEEAEALCSRIGIMAKGTLRCIANSLRLKELYGSGFRVYFNTEASDMEKACAFVEGLLPSGFRKIDAFATMASYEFPSSQNAISNIFEKMESGKSVHGVLDWGISQTTLEDVFVKIISEDDANAD
ncbi:hypothetical protein BDR26DRAFT_840473 [Obelidium mucronatum]|nr:hypothetical protein BDR26DRAFT_840473 [Obelidium mucronatum]